MRPDAVGQFLIWYGMGMFGSSIAATLFYFYVRDIIHSEPMLVIFLLLYIASGATGMLVWNKIASYVGLLRTWRLAMLYSVLTFSAAAFLKSGDDMAFAALCVISGFASGADFFMPIDIMKQMNQSVDDEPQRRRNWAMMAAVGKGAAMLGCLPLLFIGVWQEMTSDEQHVALIVAYVALPCLIKMVAVGGWSRWISNYGGAYEKISVRSDAYVA